MSDSPRFRLINRSPYLAGVASDPTLGRERGFIEPELETIPGAVINVENAMSGKVIVEDGRAFVEAGVHAPLGGRQPGGDRAELGVYARREIDFSMKIFSQKLPNAPQFAPELRDWFNPPTELADVAARGQAQTEILWSRLLGEGAQAQSEYSFARSLFGDDLAGTNSFFNYGSISADATHNPDGLTLADPNFKFIKVMASMCLALDLAAGRAMPGRYTLTLGAVAAADLEENLGLLGIKVVGDPAAGVAAVNAAGNPIRLTPEGVKRRILEACPGIGKVLIGKAVVSLTDAGDASASHSWMWPNGFNLAAIGHTTATQGAINRSNIHLDYSTGLVVFRRPTSGVKIWLPEDERVFHGKVDIIRGHCGVNPALGFSRSNA
jgi:hypothetical protein